MSNRFMMPPSDEIVKGADRVAHRGPEPNGQTCPNGRNLTSEHGWGVRESDKRKCAMQQVEAWVERARGVPFLEGQGRASSEALFYHGEATAERPQAGSEQGGAGSVGAELGGREA